MKTYDATCPVCGHKNMNLYLEETEGWMECEKCQQVSLVRRTLKKTRLPVFRMDELDKIEAYINLQQSVTAGN